MRPYWPAFSYLVIGQSKREGVERAMCARRNQDMCIEAKTKDSSSPQSGHVDLQGPTPPSPSSGHFPFRHPGQRFSSPIPIRAESMCIPHPLHVTLLHVAHLSFQHMFYVKCVVLSHGMFSARARHAPKKTTSPDRKKRDDAVHYFYYSFPLPTRHWNKTLSQKTISIYSCNSPTPPRPSRAGGGEITMFIIIG